jgi:hypothetical protein
MSNDNFIRKKLPKIQIISMSYFEYIEFVERLLKLKIVYTILFLDSGFWQHCTFVQLFSKCYTSIEFSTALV